MTTTFLIVLALCLASVIVLTLLLLWLAVVPAWLFNKTQDEIFPVEGVHVLFNAIPGSDKRLMFWDGKHDDWPPEAIDQTVTFINAHVG